MPPTRRRHTITETEEIERALRPLRARGIRISFPDLVIKGAESALDEARAIGEDEKRRARGREAFLERTRTGAGIDLDAALEVRETGWMHETPR